MTSALFGLNNLAPEGVGQNFRTTMRRFPATVTVITACATGDQRDHGMTVTAVTSVSMEPPSSGLPEQPHVSARIAALPARFHRECTDAGPDCLV